MTNNAAKPHGERRMIAFVFLSAATVRLSLLAWLGPATGPDSDDYLRLAQNLLTHGTLSLDAAPPLTPSIRFPPLYPAFIAAVSWTGTPSAFTVAAVQSVLDAATAVVLLLLARTAVARRWALAVALTYALHPGMLRPARAVISETLFTALLVCAVWTLSRGVRSDRLRATALSGVVFGAAILCRPIALLLPFTLSCVVILLRPSRRAFAHGLVLVGAAALVVTPWSLRSSRAAGRFVAVQDSTVVAALFYTASRWDWDQRDETRLWPQYVEEQRRLVAAAEADGEAGANGGRKEVRADKILFREGVRNIREHPGEYLASRARSLPHLVVTSFDAFTGINRSYETLLAERDGRRLAAKLLLSTTFSLLPLLLGIAGLPSSREGGAAALCAGVWLYVLVMYSPLWVEARYWVPATPFLLVSAARGASRLWRRFGRRAEGGGSTRCEIGCTVPRQVGR